MGGFTINDNTLKVNIVLANIAVSLVTLFSLIQLLQGEYLQGILLFFSSFFMSRYIIKLEKLANVDKKTIRLGRISYFVASFFAVMYIFGGTNLLF